MLRHQRAIAGLGKRAPAERNHARFFPRRFLQAFGFKLTKVRFPSLPHNFANRLPRALDNLFVQINERRLQLRDQRSATR